MWADTGGVVLAAVGTVWEGGFPREADEEGGRKTVPRASSAGESGGGAPSNEEGRDSEEDNETVIIESFGDVTLDCKKEEKARHISSR